MTQRFRQYFKHLMLGAFLVLQILNIAPVMAYDGWGWTIKNFSTTIRINTDSTINVTEHIVVDFSQEEHHGIYRLIPVKYTDNKGHQSEIPIHVVSVTDDTGKAWPYNVLDQDNYINIKIGDPNVYVHQVVSYNISYNAERALGNYDNYDEIYWNATGDKWEVPIEQADATVILPKAVDMKDLKATCFTGNYGSTEKNCTAAIVDGSTIKYSTSPKVKPTVFPALNAYEGLTIVGGYPKGIVQPTPPTLEELYAKAPWYGKIFYFFLMYWGLMIPFATAAYMTFLWYIKGRDPRDGKTAIVPLYTAPDNLTPTEVGTIIDERVDIGDITAAIVDLAVRGYLKIVEKKKESKSFSKPDYTFQLLKKNFSEDKKLKSFEIKILSAVFKGDEEKDLSDLKNNFYKNVDDIQKDIYTSLVSKGYFAGDPEKTRNKYLGSGCAFIIFPVSLIGGLIIFLPWHFILGLILCGFVLIGFGKHMPARTLKGVQAKYKILGLEEFIKTAEADRMKFQEKENIFEKLLPYAMTLGIADKWTKAFEGIYKTPPDWYSSNDPNFMNNFNSRYFLNNMNSLSTSVATTFQSAPRSSGSGFSSDSGGFSSGGFSGGGGGGGGGGAW